MENHKETSNRRKSIKTDDSSPIHGHGILKNGGSQTEIHISGTQNNSVRINENPTIRTSQTSVE